MRGADSSLGKAPKAQGGVLEISNLSEKPATVVSSGPQRNATAKSTQARLKVVMRRLPPGLTRNEAEDALGDEWKVGKGRVNWASFRPGKVSRDLSKPSRPSRYYLQVTDPRHLDSLNDKFRQISFTDARNTVHDSALIGPPALDFATYARVPTNKRRNDARQGTIDQDPEFIEFLESLTNPIQKVKALDPSDIIKDEPVSTTPLIEHLRERKAAKEKAPAKSGAKNQKQEARGGPKSVTVVLSTDGKSEGKKGSVAKREAAAEKKEPGKGRVEKPSREAPKGPPSKKEKAIGINATSQDDISHALPVSTTPEKQASPQDRSRDVGQARTSAAARMIQRDLGLRGGRRGGLRGAAQNAKGDEINQKVPSRSTDASSEKRATGSDSGLVPGTTSMQSPLNPSPTSTDAADTLNNNTNQTKPTSSQLISKASQAQNSAKCPPASSDSGRGTTATATRAFLKHANPSQGMTEPLIKEALQAFGSVTYVEIDKRKGFAYVDFVEPKGLQAAIAASPVSVAQGSVQVLERRERNTSATQVNAASSANRRQSSSRSGNTASGDGVGAGTSPVASRKASTAGSATQGSARGGGRGRNRGTQAQFKGTSSSAPSEKGSTTAIAANATPSQQAPTADNTSLSTT